VPDPRTGADAAAAVETLRARAAELPDWLRAHTGRVVAEGRRLAQLHEVDPLRVQAAAWGHDLYRNLDDEALRRAARDLAIAPDPAEQSAPILLHGPLAAARAQRTWGIGDAEVLDAIRVHTTGRPGMGPVALTVFLADKLEPAKVAADPGLAGIRIVAERDPVGALLAFLDRRIAHYVSAGRVLHPLAIETRNWALTQVRVDGSNGSSDDQNTCAL
jgi:predicted HD superfamily hydrolase involved in NAD metabolism